MSGFGVLATFDIDTTRATLTFLRLSLAFGGRIFYIRKKQYSIPQDSTITL